MIHIAGSTGYSFGYNRLQLIHVIVSARCVQFPLSANYPLQGQQPPIISTSMDYLGSGCGTDDISHLADITFDATTLTVTMTKVSERFGSPVTSTTPAKRRVLLANETTLYALMLFNFSKPGKVQHSKSESTLRDPASPKHAPCCEHASGIRSEAPLLDC